MDSRYLTNRTVDYWTQTYGLTQLPDQGAAAAFLNEIQEKVFSTGKSLALLRLVCPGHHLCGRYRDVQPSLLLAVTAGEQMQLRRSVEAYTEALTEAARQDCISLKEKKEKEAEERSHEAAMVAKRHEQVAANLRQQMADQAQAKKDRQQRQYDDLMRQADQARARRAHERRAAAEA